VYHTAEPALDQRGFAVRRAVLPLLRLRLLPDDE